MWLQSQVRHISIRTSTTPTGKYTTLSQMNYLRNYPLPLALLMRHTMTSVIPSVQQQNYQFNAVAKTTTDHVGMCNANTSTRLFYRLLRMKQLVQLFPSCCPILMKSNKIAGSKLSITSTSCTPVDRHGINLII